MGNEQRIMVTIRKGGARKSSLVAGVGGTLAASGFRVVLIDWDPQVGNLTNSDLGLRAKSDNGRSLAMVAQYGVSEQVRLEAIPTGRENLSLVPGGTLLSGMAVAMATQGGIGQELASNIDAGITELVDRTGAQIVLMDTPPGNDSIVPSALLSVADWLLIPSVEDGSSILGVQETAAEFIRAQSNGATIDLLGVVLCGLNPKATARNERTRAQVEAFMAEGSDPLVFDSFIRADAAAAKDLRDRHVLPAELVEVGDQVRSETLKSLRAGKKPSGRLWSRNGVNLALDYQAVTREMMQRIQQRALVAD